MPNWCNNEMSVTGPEEQIAAFRSSLIDENQTDTRSVEILNKLLPLPEGTTEMVGTTSVFTPTGYETTLELWGSKWGDCDTEFLADEPNYLGFHFTSAWSPPINGMIHISEMFPELVFVMFYEEPGNCFRGRTTIKNGEVIDEIGDEDFYLNTATMEKLGATPNEIENAREMFWDIYGDYVYDFEMTSDKLTQMIMEEVRSGARKS